MKTQTTTFVFIVILNPDIVLSMFLLPFIFVIEYGPSDHHKWKWVCAGFSLLIHGSVLLLEIQLSRREGWDPHHLLRLPHFCACPKPGFGFLSVYVMVYFAFNDLIWEVQINFIFNDNVGYILIVFMLQYKKVQNNCQIVWKWLKQASF